MTPADPAQATAAVGEHRARLLAAMAEALRDNPFAEVTVSEVVRRARTSRRTFYQHFADRDACLVALLQDRNTQTVASVEAAIDPELPLPEQVTQAVAAWIEEVAADPGLTLAWIREVPALGSAGRELTRLANDAFADLIARVAEEAGAGDLVADRAPLALVLIGGLRELVARAVEDGEDVRQLGDAAASAALALLSGASPPE
ncbi:TetR/AcrR family transcriptional regulator [Nocardioides sp. zg-DK7169]|uniref:TetR/AcrR family transcriptional regulator n=1 Tax=Nocardioides sp. zg-DK7169 TaxID=2736600 RepID=UPI001551A8B8|nr:TetR/AcrR family transcriptional regulator [Nocardioides sp. zg-DK7169]NPC97391.1 TetR/AcrR family transcriptional regulator [Nocardioides sp. zg-DK7169]